MTLSALLDDALRTEEYGFSLRLALPWIRSLPLSSVTQLSLTVDDSAVSRVSVVVGGLRMSPTDLAGERGWWFMQDRLVLQSDTILSPGKHQVGISFSLVIPYLRFGPDVLSLPFVYERRLRSQTAPAFGSVARDVA